MAGMRVALIGSGAWGTTLAMLALGAGSETRLYVRAEDEAKAITSARTNARHLPGIVLPEKLRISSDLGEALHRADVAILAVPSQSMRASAAAIRPHLRDAIVVSAAKGLERGTLQRMTQVLADELPSSRVCAISGPNLAREIADGKPATTVVAGTTITDAERVRAAIMTSRFRCYTNEDVVGVEMGGALKNIIAIGAGLADGLQAGDNAKAAFITRGMAEITRLGVAAGADPLTFAGLSGLGDLIATCASPLSRNYRVGRELATGKRLDEIRAALGSVAEGVDTTAAAWALGNRMDVDLPIVGALHQVLFDELPVAAAISALMGRDATHELGGLRSILDAREAREAIDSGD